MELRNGQLSYVDSGTGVRHVSTGWTHQTLNLSIHGLGKKILYFL